MATKHVSYVTAPKHLQRNMVKAWQKSVAAQRQIRGEKKMRRIKYWSRVDVLWADKFRLAIKALKPWAVSWEVYVDVNPLTVSTS